MNQNKNPEPPALAEALSKKSIQPYLPSSALAKTVTTFPAIWESKTPTLGGLSVKLGEETAKNLIMAWIIHLSASLNVGRGMTDFQIRDAAEVLLIEFPYLTVADIAFVFRKAKTGYYGELYDRLDITVISRWFHRHWSERLQAAETQSYTAHLQSKSDPFPRSSNDEKDRTAHSLAHTQYLFENSNPPNEDTPP
jgi:hypothetical protein